MENSKKRRSAKSLEAKIIEYAELLKGKIAAIQVSDLWMFDDRDVQHVKCYENAIVLLYETIPEIETLDKISCSIRYEREMVKIDRKMREKERNNKGSYERDYDGPSMNTARDHQSIREQYSPQVRSNVTDSSY